MKQSIISTTRDRRRKRIRAKISGTAERPRLSVYKSNAYIYAQVIDDSKGVTLAAASSMNAKGNKTEAAKAVGAELAKLAKSKGISKIVFDRGGFIFTGRVRALADGAREGGLEF
ncbi:MAG TPA: 50S ribosomal protein L18 [Candidatus Paceibacterota bacterium]